MWKTTLASLLVALLLPCPSPAGKEPLPPPDPNLATIGISIGCKNCGPGKSPAELVYFVHLAETDGFKAQKVIPSNHFAHGQAYLLNADPGRYVAVGYVVAGSGGFFSLVTNRLFSKELINATAVEVGAGEMAHMGDYLVRVQRVGIEELDELQLHYHRLLRPDRAEAGKGTYRADLLSVRQDSEASLEFWRRATTKVFRKEAAWRAVAERQVSRLEREGDMIAAAKEPVRAGAGPLAEWRGLFEEGVTALDTLQNFARAEELLLQALEVAEGFGSDDERVGVSLYALGLLRGKQGRFPEATAAIERSLAIAEKALGPSSPDLVGPLNWLAMIYLNQARLEEAEGRILRSVEIGEVVFGPQHLNVATAYCLAELHQALGRLAEAEAVLASARRRLAALLGPGHPAELELLAGLADLYHMQQRYPEAQQLLEPALAATREVHGKDSPETASVQHRLGSVLADQGRFEQAAKLLQSALRTEESTRGKNHPTLAGTLGSLSLVYLGQGRLDKAEPLLHRALEIAEEVLGPEHPRVATVLEVLARLRHKQGDLAEAQQHFERSLAIREKVYGPRHPVVAEVLEPYSGLLRDIGRSTEAEAAAARAEGIRSAVSRMRASDAVAGSEVTTSATGRVLHGAHYSIRVPAGWLADEVGGDTDSIHLFTVPLITRLGQVQVRLQLAWSPVSPPLAELTASEAADFVRHTEKMIMLEMGVGEGLYKLDDVTMGQQEVAGRTFYYMDYRIRTPTDHQSASLYLWFPEAERNQAFFMAHHSVVTPPEMPLAAHPKIALLRILETLEPAPAGDLGQEPAATKTSREEPTELAVLGEAGARDRLSARTGKWTFIQRVWPAPGEPPFEWTGTSEVTPVMDGRYALEMWEGSLAGMTIHGIVVIGRQPIEGAYVGVAISDLADPLSFRGSCDEPASLCTFEAISSDPAESYKMVEHTVDADHWVMEGYVRGPDGKEWKSFECHYERDR